MCYYKSILPTPNIKKYNDFLFIAAHTCDIEKAAGATVKKLTDAGKRVKFLITTDSTSFLKNEPDHAKRREIKQKEEMASGLLLGVKEIEFLDLTDTGRYDDGRMGELIEDSIYAFQPDVVFMDDDTTPNEILMDDKRTTKEALKAVERVRNPYLQEEKGRKKGKIKAIAFYNATRPNYYYGVAGAIGAKVNAVMLHRSLLPTKEEEIFRYMQTYKNLAMRTAFATGCKGGKLLAEGFRVLGSGAMHNVPQINR